LVKEYRSFSSSLCNFLHSPVTSSLLGPNFLLVILMIIRPDQNCGTDRSGIADFPTVSELTQTCRCGRVTKTLPLSNTKIELNITMRVAVPFCSRLCSCVPLIYCGLRSSCHWGVSA
jgi:hypothetical protein